MESELLVAKELEPKEIKKVDFHSQNSETNLCPFHLPLDDVLLALCTWKSVREVQLIQALYLLGSRRTQVHLEQMQGACFGREKTGFLLGKTKMSLCHGGHSSPWEGLGKAGF